MVFRVRSKSASETTTPSAEAYETSTAALVEVVKQEKALGARFEAVDEAGRAYSSDDLQLLIEEEKVHETPQE